VFYHFAVFYEPLPLPSAGIIPVLQLFCNRNGGSVYTHENPR